MEQIPIEYLNIGAVAIVFVFCVKEFFKWLGKKGQKGELNGYGKLLLDEMKTQNQNHLHTIETGMNDGFDRIVDTLNNNDKQIIQLLGEIKGVISRIK